MALELGNGNAGIGVLGTSVQSYLGVTGSVSFWFRTDDVSPSTNFWEYPGFVGVEINASTDDIFWGTIDDTGRLGGQAGNGARAESTNVVNDDTWHHFLMTRDSSSGEVNVYIDGTLNQSVTSETGTKTGVITDFGRGSGGSFPHIDSVLDDLRLYDVVLTAAEAATIHACRGTDGIVRGLRSRFTFKEDAPGVQASGSGLFKDIAADGNNATPDRDTGGPSNNPDFAEGVLRTRRRVG